MNRSITVLALASAVALAACDDATGPEGTVPVSLSLVAAPAGPPPLQMAGVPPVARTETYGDGTNTLVIDRVAVVVRQIELERLFDDDCDSIQGDDDPCEEFETGPYLLELPLDGTVDQVFTIDVPPESYKELEFDIHKPGDDPNEAAFVLANPDFDDVSVRVEGSWNGSDFVFTQDMNTEQEIEFATPLVIEEGMGPVNLTLSLDIEGWFRSSTGDLIDPTSANKGGPNEDVVEANIERSFEIFEDDDRDGIDDDDDSIG